MNIKKSIKKKLKYIYRGHKNNLLAQTQKTNKYLNVLEMT